MSHTILQVQELVKRFGGLVATDHCNLEIRTGEIHALIGPNGAGKTTLLAQLCGELAPDSGRILFEGRDITRLPIHKRVSAGIVRSFQITTLLPRLTVRENLALAVQARTGHSFDFLGTVADESDLDEGAEDAARRVGLIDVMEQIVGTLSHGKQRALELGMALACKPRLLLLDEPMAGTDPEESKRMGELIHSLREDHTLILVEHDMDAVFRLADRVSVLVAGAVIASGTPEQIRNDPQVISAYLGDDESAETEAVQ
ncbi:MAG: ABC transporter ATP-binding protein [Azoarcus sp.]|uniref:ABC transporter ATP-binding protein n=1 Tax=Parazoarcus communis TaxID=41977 RepID=A0A2U8GLN3_9RHOO|nr:ABC transporter ATP-binding protein [Parazoarcus communis]AWI74394.1 ABC transporter ATP-binding protein [Parazoarcus communis]PLX76833.1 MAG: ABC transporter ATP-binding protein [Azoarcus sp.]TVT54669.1 MAG: ABC transporter ATP-binding protein [Azoarcus sp. PHD]|tara:strand:- start:11644 stop:12417 length:774 start_codon:yes stop_codon:yes gene_type:complete